MARTPTAAIIGGGLAACLALQRRGIEAVVYEQTAELNEIGAGLNSSPNALKAFRALGVKDEAIAIGCQPYDRVIRNWRTGRVIARQQRGRNIAERFGAIFISIHRAELLAILAHALPDGCIRLGAKCTEVAAVSEGAMARFADGAEIEADIIIGAVGIHSAVRESLFGPIEPSFTGCICWWGLVPIEAVTNADYA